MIGGRFPGVLADAARGDAVAIEALYRDTVPIVRGYLAAQGAPEVDDVVSDVYVSMMGSIHRFEGDEHSFRSWLLTIAHRRLTDAFRKLGRRKEDAWSFGVGPGEVDVIDITDIESVALTRLRTSGVMRAIDGLTEDQRAVLLLRVVADLTIRDIADVVGKPETAVKALLRRALASLDRAMSIEGGDDELSEP